MYNLIIVQVQNQEEEEVIIIIVRIAIMEENKEYADLIVDKFNLKENNTNDIIKNNDEILSNNTVENNDEILNNDILVQVSDGDIEKVKIYKVIEIIDNSGNSRIELKEESLSSVNLFDKTYIIIRNSN